MKLGNVIVTFNRKELLLEAIRSLMNQSVHIEKIIIIDNHSTDGTFKLLEESGILEKEQVEYFYLEKNIGGSGGFEYGLKKAMEYDLDWITLSDDDAIYSPNYFSLIENAIQENHEIKIFTGTVKLPDGRIQITHRRSISNWSIISDTFIPEDSYSQNFYLDLFTFVGVTISTDLIKIIGLPEKDYFIWWDDIEYSLRARRYTKILNISDAIIKHKTKVISMDFSKKYVVDWREYYGWRNKIFTLRKHASNKLTINIYLILWIVKRYLRLLKPFYKGHRRYLIKLYSRSFFDAYFHRLGLNKYYKP